MSKPASNPYDNTLLSDPCVYGQGIPYDEFARRRRECPVSWVDEIPQWLHDSDGGAVAEGTGYWAITTHRTVESVSRDPQTFSSAARGAFLADPKSRQDLERTRQSLINMDAPEHATLRKVISHVFTPSSVRQIADLVRMHAAAIVNGVLDKEFDVVKDVAAELPLLVLTDLLGIPREDRRLMLEWSNNLVGFDDPEYGGGNVAAYQRTFYEAFQYAKALAATKRTGDGNDLTTMLVQCKINDRQLTDSEFCHLWILLVVGGNESTRHFISGSLKALTEWPEECNQLCQNEDLVPSAVEELLRWVSPIMQFRRTATKDVNLEGKQIKQGDKVVLYYISANRDEEMFPSADCLDLSRSPNPHLSFGAGPHFCLGAHLARLEAATLIKELRPHLSRFELTGPVTRLKSNFMNGIKSMPARFAN